MPTTLFVLVNAVINAFRMVDHIVVHDARRARQRHARCCSITSTRSASASGTRPTRRRSPWCCWRCSARVAFVPVRLPRPAGRTTDERARRPTTPSAPARRSRALETAAAWLLGAALDPAARLRGVDGVPSGGVLDALRARRAADAARTSRSAWDAAPFARYFLNTILLVTMILGAQLVLVHARGLRLRALRVPRPRRRVRAGAACS